MKDTSNLLVGVQSDGPNKSVVTFRDQYQTEVINATFHIPFKESVEIANRFAKSKKVEELNVELLDALKTSLSYFADLNGSNWITDEGAGGLDMKQRAKAIQSVLYKLLNK